MKRGTRADCTAPTRAPIRSPGPPDSALRRNFCLKTNGAVGCRAAASAAATMINGLHYKCLAVGSHAGSHLRLVVRTGPPEEEEEEEGEVLDVHRFPFSGSASNAAAAAAGQIRGRPPPATGFEPGCLASTRAALSSMPIPTPCSLTTCIGKTFTVSRVGLMTKSAPPC